MTDTPSRGLSPGLQRFWLAIAALAAVLLALGGLGLYCLMAAKPDASIIASVLVLISTTLGGVLTTAYRHIFPAKGEGPADPPTARS